MLNLTRKVDYAILVLTHLGLGEEAAWSARQVSARYGLSPSLTASVLKSLQRGGLVTSTRGARGGYALARAPAEINLNHVIEAVEGCWSMVECRIERHDHVELCEIFSVCPIRGAMGDLAERIRALLDETTIETFVDHARRAQAGPGGDAGTFVEIAACAGRTDAPVEARSR